jgi:ribosomal protein L34E
VISEARGTEWVVYAKRPFGGPRTVLKYLARYTHTHRVAISNYRLLSSEDGTVAFRYKDYARGRRLRTLRLEATEFIRRFLLHALPRGFVRIRRYGLLANAQREQKLARCRELLSGLPRNRPSEAPYTEITAYEPGGYRCPSCGEGIMRRPHLAFSCASLRPRPPPVQESS